ncbi:unnamed protein product [Linum tenue]|uniref:F-box domain-containing protein n=1 Tax=Linum tenue TaxID=586396 RepID=A0AAV0JZX5_9ROSI|nr:unnamed protein product [Linum tenue]
MTNRGGSPWADLPEEILEAIGSRIDHPINVLNFRSVCSSWRSAVRTPDFHHPIPPIEVRLPYPGDVDGVLVPSTLCFVEFHSPPIPNGDSTFAVAGGDDAPRGGGGWLIKVEETSRGKLQLLNPISNLKIRYSPIQLSLLDFRPVQLTTSFRLRFQVGCPTFEINKVLPFPPSAASAVTVIAIFHEGRIGYWRNGDERWTLLDGRSFDYDDVIIHRGQYYVTDRLGKLSLIDSSLRFDESYPSPRGGGQKNLVESGGDLYLVDRYLSGRRRNWKDVDDAITNSFHPIRFLVGTRRGRKWNPRAVDFKVYKLDEEIGEWVEVKSLGDDGRVFVLTTECCFSAPAAQIAGGKKDCIYYSDDDDYVARNMMRTESIRVFQLGDGSIEEVKTLPRESNVFLPPGFRMEF